MHLIEPLRDRVDVPPKFVKWDTQHPHTEMTNSDVFRMISMCANILIDKDEVLEDLHKTPDVGNMRYKSGSAALKHGAETSASYLRSSSMFTSVASGKVENNIVVELDPPNMFQLIPTQDTGFHGVVNDYGHDDFPKTPTKYDFDLEGRLKECLLLLENER
ncbi:hypothetical protein ACE6H2_020609 [Prunus campanulata]